MHILYKYLIACCLALCLALPLHAQLDLTVFSATGRGGVATTFATDYQALGINPANLGVVKSFRDPFLTFGFGESSVAFSAEAIPRNKMVQALRETITLESSGYEQLSYAEKIEAGRRMAGTDISINAGVMLFGFGVRLPGSHGFAFSARSQMRFYANMNSALTDLLFMGANSSYFERQEAIDGERGNPRNPKYSDLPALTDEQYAGTIKGALDSAGTGQAMAELMAGSRITSSLTNEYNLGYGARLYDSYNFALYGGLDISVIRGVMLLNIDVDKDQNVRHNAFALPDGLVLADSAQLAFDSGTTWTDLAFPSGVSSGIGYTLGMTAVIKKNLRFGASISNWRGPFGNAKLFRKVGAIVLSNNAYAISTTSTLEEFTGQGLDSYNIFASSPSAFAIAGSEGTAPYEWGRVEFPEQELPANLRMGLSYNFVETLHLGLDFIIPLNRAFGNPSGPFMAIGGDFRLSRLIRVSSGMNAIIRSERQAGQGVFRRVNFPIGITYTARKGTYEAGIATKDILTYVARGDGSTISFASGFLRFMIKGNRESRRL